MLNNNQFKLIDPAISYQDAKKLFIQKNKEEDFLNFNYSTKNKFVREYLYLQQHGICPYCGQRIFSPNNDGVVHHQTYAHHCSSEHPTIRVYLPRDRDRTYRTVPNCELCYYMSPDKADKCLSCLVMVHADCHKKLHNK